MPATRRVSVVFPDTERTKEISIYNAYGKEDCEYATVDGSIYEGIPRIRQV